jgi:hypothetical protein
MQAVLDRWPEQEELLADFLRGDRVVEAERGCQVNCVTGFFS